MDTEKTKIEEMENEMRSLYADQLHMWRDLEELLQEQDRIRSTLDEIEQLVAEIKQKTLAGYNTVFAMNVLNKKMDDCDKRRLAFSKAIKRHQDTFHSSISQLNSLYEEYRTITAGTHRLMPLDIVQQQYQCYEAYQQFQSTRKQSMHPGIQAATSYPRTYCAGFFVDFFVGLCMCVLSGNKKTITYEKGTNTRRKKSSI